MTSQNNLTAVFTDIANAIRDKKGSVNTIKPINMADEILTIETGGGKSFIYQMLEKKGTSWAGAFYGNQKNLFTLVTEYKESDFPPSNNITHMNYMFYGNSSLTSIPQLDTSSVRLFGNMFNGCYYLEKIDITLLYPDSNNSAYTSNMFNFCYSLKTLIIRTMSIIPSIPADLFDSCYHFVGTTDSTFNPNGLKDGRIYVPDDKVASLKTATNWSVFADIIKPLSEYVE